jgi:molecular chaperone GrpE (heat shock protein)
MKSGAGSPFDDFDDEDESEEEAPESETETGTGTESQETSATEGSLDDGLPYKYQRENIQDGRDRANLFLRDEAEADIERLIDAMDKEFESEAVYKIDVLEAALMAAANHPDSVSAELRQMGYGMK